MKGITAPDEIYFKEVQRFRQWWLWAILVLSHLLFAVTYYQQTIIDESITGKSVVGIGFLSVWVVLLLVTLLFGFAKLETIITREWVCVRFSPFHTNYRKFESQLLTNAYVRQYSPLSEYGGWGPRLAWNGRDYAYTVSGNQGLQLELENGKKLLVGTQIPHTLVHALKKFYGN